MIRIISILTIASATLYFYLTITTLRIKPRTTTHWLLGASAFVLTFWAFFAYLTYNAQDIEEFKRFFFISITAVFFFFPLQNFFVRYMTGSLRPWYILLFAVPAALFALKNFDGTVTFSDFYLSDKGWVFVSAQGTVWNTLWSVYTAVALGTAIIYLVAHSRRIELQREKKQTRLLIIFSALSMALMEADYLLHDHFIDLRTVSLTPLLLIPWVAGYVIAIKRFHFLNLTTDMVTRQILETINELVILVDSDGKPTYMNAKALEFFQKPLRKIDEIRTDELLLQTDEGESLLPRVYEGGIVKKRIAFGTSDSENTQTVLDMEITHIYDRFNDPLGFLLIGRKVQSLESLQSQYNLTEREADVVGCIINGWKTQVIAEYLEISERTVKTHISNIYQKLGVTNRVSLINILGQGEGH